MNAKALLIVLVVGLVAFVIASAVGGQFSGEAELTKFYEGCINKYISRCQTKVSLFEGSRFRNLRESASVAGRKAEFFSKHKDLLIDEMLERAIDRKYYKVEMYLNQKFQKAAVADDYALSGVPERAGE